MIRGWAQIDFCHTLLASIVGDSTVNDISSSIGVTSIGIEEPKYFNEPGVFLIKPNKTLYYGLVQTMPFARPPFRDLLLAINFSNEKNYPARGDYVGEGDHRFYR